MDFYLDILSGTLMFLGGVPFYFSMKRGPGHPMIVTWLMYAVLDCITFGSMWSAGTLNGQIIGTVAVSVPTFLLTLKYGETSKSVLELTCIAIGIFGLFLWYWFSSPLVAFGMSLLLVTIGSAPTYKSAWDNPKNENGWAWILFFLSSIPAIYLIKAWTFKDAAQPITYILIQGSMLCLIYRPTRSVPVTA
jgi:hypothetical protein